MPTCRLHGSGGESNKDLGQLRYMCWVITGCPQDMPVEKAARIALYSFAVAVFDHGVGTVEQKLKAAMWITNIID